MKINKIIENVEYLVDPITIGSIHFFQKYNNMLPISLQNKMMESSAMKYPYMGFIVEPYCTFLFQKITNVDYFNSIIPDNFEIIKCSPFKKEEEDFYLILSFFNARTSAFFGSRVEAYVIAKNQNTGLTSWIIIDYVSNTISHDEKDGLVSPSVQRGYVTSDFNGNTIANMNDETHSTEISIDMNNGVSKDLDYNLWVEGNLSISYGKKYSEKGDVFSLKFDKGEMLSALDIPVEDISIYKNNWFESQVEKNPSKIVVFKYAQHFISDSPGNYNVVNSADDMYEEILSISNQQLIPYSTLKMEKMVFLTPLILIFIIIILLLLIILL